MDDAVLGDVMRLMKSADVQRMVSEMQASVSELCVTVKSPSRNLWFPSVSNP